jgi:flagellar biosynthesis regulator FlbT
VALRAFFVAEDRTTALRPLIFLAMVMAALPVGADPPSNANPAFAPWFRGLLQPGTGISCCSISDCRATEYRVQGDHYEALIGERWLTVPPDRILQRTDNPTGHAIVCWTPERGIVCFVRTTES